MSDQVVVQVRFSVAAEGHYPALTDALLFSFEEWAAGVAPAQLAALKTDRHAAWKAAYDAAQVPVPRTRAVVVREVRDTLIALYQRASARDDAVAEVGTLGAALTVQEIRAALASAGLDLSLLQVNKLLS